MEKEDVLKIKTVKMNAEYMAVTITYQNTDVLKRGKFMDGDIKVMSSSNPIYYEDIDALYIRGTETETDNKVFVVENRHFQNIQDKVNKINEKYGIKKRWRAEEGESYYFIYEDFFRYISAEQMAAKDDERWEAGNYFKTEKEANKMIKKIKKLLKERECKQ